MLRVCFYLRLRIRRFPIIVTHTDKAEDKKKLKKYFFMYFIEGDNNVQPSRPYDILNSATIDYLLPFQPLDLSTWGRTSLPIWNL